MPRRSWLLVAALGVAACTSSGESSSESSGEAPIESDPAVPSVAEEPQTTAGDENEPSEEQCAGDPEPGREYAYREIAGVDAEMLSLDVYAPPDARGCPVVIWVHGGGWQNGDKKTNVTGVKAAHFVGEGYVFVAVNYRLAAANNDVRWPAFGDDVAAAAAWVIDHADVVGGDPDRVTLVGHSAGAHLVSIVGTNPDLLDAFGKTRDQLPCIASLDTEAYDLDSPEQTERDIVQVAFDPDDLVDGSPIDQALEHADDGPIGEFLVVTRGGPRRIATSQDFVDVLTETGGVANIADVNPYNHRDVNVRLGEPDELLVTPVVTDFLATCLENHRVPGTG